MGWLKDRFSEHSSKMAFAGILTTIGGMLSGDIAFAMGIASLITNIGVFVTKA